MKHRCACVAWVVEVRTRAPAREAAVIDDGPDLDGSARSDLASIRRRHDDCSEVSVLNVIDGRSDWK